MSDHVKRLQNRHSVALASGSGDGEALEAAAELERLASVVAALRAENERLRAHWDAYHDDADERAEALEAEVATLRGEIAAFRKAIVDGTGPSCEDVCQRSCIGACGGL